MVTPTVKMADQMKTDPFWKTENKGNKSAKDTGRDEDRGTEENQSSLDRIDLRSKLEQGIQRRCQQREGK